MKHQLTKTLAGGRTDQLAALVTVSHEQLQDRRRTKASLAATNAKVTQLTCQIFGSEQPSVRAYLAAQNTGLAA